jgi:pimeloyl-ACP methyl ester carboxylesterase
MMPSQTATTHSLTVSDLGQVALTVDERGDGRPFLLLHGGGGPQSVAGFAALLSTAEHARVLSPTHLGFGGTVRPDALDSIAKLAMLYAALLEQRDLRDVSVVGNSIGGWIAAELALRAPSRLSSLILVDAVGIAVPEHPIVDFFSLTLDQVAQLSYHDPDTFRVDPATLSAEAQTLMAGNRAALAVYGGTAMADPTLRGRLAGLTMPTLVLWGESDRIVDPDYGRAYAEAIPGAGFEVLPATGHLPQIETPEQLLRAVWPFADAHATRRPAC